MGPTFFWKNIKVSKFFIRIQNSLLYNDFEFIFWEVFGSKLPLKFQYLQFSLNKFFVIFLIFYPKHSIIYIYCLFIYKFLTLSFITICTYGPEKEEFYGSKSPILWSLGTNQCLFLQFCFPLGLYGGRGEHSNFWWGRGQHATKNGLAHTFPNIENYRSGRSRAVFQKMGVRKFCK